MFTGSRGDVSKDIRNEPSIGIFIQEKTEIAPRLVTWNIDDLIDVSVKISLIKATFEDLDDTTVRQVLGENPAMYHQ